MYRAGYIALVERVVMASFLTRSVGETDVPWMDEIRHDLNETVDYGLNLIQ